jgi:hypothetical protein
LADSSGAKCQRNINSEEQDITTDTEGATSQCKEKDG